MELTVPQAAKRTKVAEETIRRWIRSGRLPSRKVGTQHVISAHDLDLVAPKRRRAASRVGEPPAAYVTARGRSDEALLSRIVVNPKVAFGKPAFRGTRIPVELVLELLSGAWSVEDVLSGYPSLTEDDIRACFAYAADRIAEERIWPAG